ncbi:peptidase domain containing protein, partial [Methylobacterium sp. WL93]
VDALVPADADAKAQLRALFAAVSTESGAAHPASRIAPVRVAQTRARTDAAPEAVVGASPDAVTTRFGRRSPGDDLTAARFTGSATRAVPGGR